ncbi:MAG TPA: glycosyltransferase family 1 protein, partial [Hymenobacter sp.]
MPLSTSAEAPPRAASPTNQNIQSDLTITSGVSGADSLPDFVCFAHLTWDFVWQRPQHLLSRFAQKGRVFYIEEPFIHHEQVEPHLEIKERQNGLKVVVAHLPGGLDEANSNRIQEELLTRYFAENAITKYLFWYYTPMALDKSRNFQPLLTVYDCMDELANFKFAPPRLQQLEQELFQRADLVFTGGQSLYEAKSKQHADA